MDLSRFDPFRELEEMSERLGRIFHAPRRASSGQGPVNTTELALWTPLVDIAETESEYRLKVELPEVKKEDVKVRVQDGVLTISGARRSEKEDKGTKWHRIERAYGSFARSFAIADDVDDAKVEATFADGVLNVRLPKSAQAKPRTVEVKVS